ncbi:MAG: hypothetical protein ABIT01_00135 [Thermoanaerobaculia bacterium]
MRKLALTLVISVIGGYAITARAQTPAAKPFELNMDRIKVSNFGGDLGLSKTFLIPTVNLIVSAKGSVWSQKGGAQAHGKFFVDGLDKSMLQDLAGKIQDDLVTRMRAAHYTVLTFDDVKNEPAFTGRSLNKPDAKWGLPTKGGFGTLTFVVASPSDAQAFDNPIQGPVWWMRDMAKEKQLIAIVPEITFTVPQMFGESSSGYKRDSAGIATDPSMVLESAMVWAINAKAGSTNVQIQKHGKRPAAESAGTIKRLSEDKTEFSSDWKRTSGDFLMTLDRPAFSEGVLRVGYAINALIVSEVGKKQK